MVFKTTFTRNRRRQSGMTLMELLVGSAVGSIVAIGTAALVFMTSRSFAAMTNYVALDIQSRNALDRISREIRQVNKLTGATDTSLTFEDSDALTLEYVWNESEGTLVRTKNGVADERPLLRDCTYLKFSIYQRNPKTGVYDQYPVATPGTCKLVQMHWVCSRTVLGTMHNTESVQSAKVVIRKQ